MSDAPIINSPVRSNFVPSGAIARWLAVAVQQARNIVLMTDADDRLVWVNDGFTRFTGYTFEEVQGRRPADFLAGDSTDPIWAEKIKEAVRGRQTFEGELYNYRKDGSGYWVWLSVTPLYGDQDEFAGFVTIQVDITERKRLEVENERLALAVQMSKALITITNANDFFVWVNDQFARQTGYTLEEVRGHLPARLLRGPATDPIQAAYMDQCAREHKPFESEIYNYRKDGSGYWVSMSATPFSNKKGEFQGYIAIQMDITARKELESEMARLKDAEIARLALAVQRTNASVIITDQKDAIQWVNEGFTRLTGFTFEDVRGRQPGSFLVGPQSDQAVVEQIGKTVGAGRMFEGEIYNYRKGGEGFWVWLSVTPLYSDSGEVYGFITIQTDITDRKTLEVELAKTVEQLQESQRKALESEQVALEANRSKSAFLANMSHELRTPLNAIIGYSEMLMEEAEDIGQGEFVPDLRKIHTAGRHLLELINAVLDLSKVEAGKMDLYLETFDIARLIHDVTAIIHPLIEKNANTLTVHCPPEIGSMRADLTKVRQSLFNLLSNASKFTHNGSISLEVRREPANDGGWIRFCIRDTGIGMTTEQMGRLFEAFSQADASTTRKFGGTGLGLAISRKFCRLMGGEIEVESEFGQGSTFTIRLPSECVEPGAHKPVAAESHAETGHSEKATILVIDDDPTMVDLLTRFLTKEGYRVEAALGGQEGLQRAKELRPEAITLDVMMPNIDGWTVLSKLKADPDLADIPVIMLTMVDDKNLGYALGVSDYLTKPLDRERLSAVLKKYVPADLSGAVMVVEDEASIREMVRRVFEKAGLTVIEAENGRVALERLATTQPALILLDLMMPEMDGFEFVDHLNQEERWASIPVVVMTAKDLTEEDRLRLHGAVRQIIQKGAQGSDELLQKIRDVVAASVAGS